MTDAISDYTTHEVLTTPSDLVSPQALERMRHLILSTGQAGVSPPDGLNLLAFPGLLSQGRLTIAGLLLAGSEQALRQVLPGFGWSYQYAPFGTEILDAQKGCCAIPEAVDLLLGLILSHSPVFTTQRKDRRVEVHPYPHTALREALWNAFGHHDLSQCKEIRVRQTSDKVEILSPGQLPEGVTPENILHALRQARNALLMKTLSLLGVAGHPTPGIEQMFWAMLSEGQSAPAVDEPEQSTRITFSGWAGFDLWPIFIEEEIEVGRTLNVDHLLLLRHLLLTADVGADAAAQICQRSEPETRRLLSEMTDWGYTRHNYAHTDQFWSLQPAMFDRFSSKQALIRQRQLYYNDLGRMPTGCSRRQSHRNRDAQVETNAQAAALA
ncbi:MAG TPA: ATP-binding protein [Anaerolineaceae bacterium]|nr:ATP-binding protein [Anaerolineaceae bacterium]HQH87035.1 ATP-binding protein [Anaerolineaceae bacterium]